MVAAGRESAGRWPPAHGAYGESEIEMDAAQESMQVFEQTLQVRDSSPHDAVRDRAAVQALNLLNPRAYVGDGTRTTVVDVAGLSLYVMRDVAGGLTVSVNREEVDEGVSVVVEDYAGVSWEHEIS